VQKYSNETNWAQDGHILMQENSHFNFFVRGLLQLCSYLVQQLPSRYKISINTEVFLSAFTMEGNNSERVHATSWTGAPDGSVYDTNAEGSVDSDADMRDSRTDTTSNSREEDHVVNADAAVGQLGIHTGQFNSIVIRRNLALKWIELQKKRYQFLAVSPEDTPDWEQMKDQIVLGPHGVRHMKPAKGKHPSSSRSEKYPKQIRKI
jgi:hypothetical protein